MSLFDAAERIASLDRSQVFLDTGRCLHPQDHYSECAACFDVCPASAITAGKPPSLDPERCELCLACLPSCPTGAFRADDDVSDLLNCATRVEGKSIELVCSLHPRPESGESPENSGLQIRGCLAGLGAGAYLMLATLGLERIVARTDACQDCKWAALKGQIHRQVDGANGLLTASKGNRQVLCLDQVRNPVERSLWKAANPPLSRRDLFRMVARQGQVAIARSMENGSKASERQPGRDRLRMTASLSHLPELAAQGSVLDGLGFATVSVSESCTACGACARGCPTAALGFEKDEAAMNFGLSFSPRSCIGCGQCEHVCAPASVTIEHSPSFGEVFGVKEPTIILEGKLVRCERCKSWMAERPGVRLCSLCEYRRANPFGSSLPPGIKLPTSPLDRKKPL